MNQNLTHYQVNGTSALNVDVRSGNRNNVIEFPGSFVDYGRKADRSDSVSSKSRIRGRHCNRTRTISSMTPLERIGYELFEGRLSGMPVCEKANTAEVRILGGVALLTAVISLIAGM